MAMSNRPRDGIYIRRIKKHTVRSIENPTNKYQNKYLLTLVELCTSIKTDTVTVLKTGVVFIF